jgi:E3 ubiquitin-protein ligase BRE1
MSQRFQKDAIHRQMQEYRREKNTLSTRLEELRQKTRFHDQRIQAIDTWFKELLDEIISLAPGDDDVDMDAGDLPTSLLFIEHPEFERHITSRSAEIRTIISRLFSRTKSFTPDIVELQKRISQLLTAEKVHNAELERLRSENGDIEARLETAIERYVVAEKKIDRAKSLTVAKLEKQAIFGPARSPTEEGAPVKKEEQVNGVADTNEGFAELEKEHKKTLALTETLKEQLERLRGDNATLTSKLTESSTKAATLSDDDYAKTELFKQLKLQHDDVVKKLNDLEARIGQLKEENKKVAHERTAYQNKLEDETRTLIAEKDMQLVTAEKDLTRIRAERDNLQADLQIKKASIEQDQTASSKIKELNAALEERIKSLESECDRFRAESGMAVDDAQLDSLSADELRSKYQMLDKNYKMLNGELTSMSTAFQKASKIANQKVTELGSMEEKVQRLSAEKAKADQKYFAAMKSKETLSGRMRTLEMQSGKYSETVSQLKEADAASRALLANIESQLAEIKESHEAKISQCRKADLEKSTHDLEIGRLNKQVAELKQLLAAKDSEMGQKSARCDAAEAEKSQTQSMLESTRRDLEKWKSKSGQSDVYENLHAMLFCHCKKNMKDTIITTCGHAMCSECVQERVKSRSRKCPRCSKSFGSNDHMKVVL